MSVTRRESILRRNPYRDRRSFVARAMGLSPIGDIAGSTLSEGTSETVTWETATDWNNSTDEKVVVHDTFGDSPGDAIIALGYPKTDQGGTNLMAYWAADDSSAPLTDVTGNGRDGTVDEGSPTFGQTGINDTAAVYLDGNDGFEAGDVDLGTSEFTITAFGKLDSNGSDRNVILCKERVFESVVGDGSIGFFNYVGDGSGWGNRIDDTTEWRDDSWHHFAVTYSDGDNHLEQWVDGSQTGVDSSYSTSIGTNNEALEIGTRSNNNSWYTQGTWDAIRLYNRRLSTTEIQNLADAATGGYLTTATKSFSGSTTPNLQNLSYTLNGESITLDVIGSPGTASEEIVSQTLDGSSSYSLTWSNSHSDFRVKVNLSATAVTATPTFSRAELVTP